MFHPSTTISLSSILKAVMLRFNHPGAQPVELFVLAKPDLLLTPGVHTSLSDCFYTTPSITIVLSPTAYHRCLHGHGRLQW